MTGLRMRYRATPDSARAARRSLTTFAQACGFSGQRLADIELATGEAIANAIEHGNKLRGFFEMRCTFDGTKLVVEIKDRGRGFEAPAQPAPGPNEKMRGWGLFLMKNLLDRVSYFENGRGVRLEMSLPQATENGGEATS